MNSQKIKEQNYLQIDGFRGEIFGERTGRGTFSATVTVDVDEHADTYNGVTCSVMDNSYGHVNIELDECVNIPHRSFNAAFQQFKHTGNTLVITGHTDGVKCVTIAKI